MFHCSAAALIKTTATLMVTVVALPVSSALATPTPTPPSPAAPGAATADPGRLHQLETSTAPLRLSYRPRGFGQLG